VLSASIWAATKAHRWYHRWWVIPVLRGSQVGREAARAWDTPKSRRSTWPKTRTRTPKGTSRPSHDESGLVRAGEITKGKTIRPRRNFTREEQGLDLLFVSWHHVFCCRMPPAVRHPTILQRHMSTEDLRSCLYCEIPPQVR